MFPSCVHVLAFLVVLIYSSYAQFRGGTISWFEYQGGKIRFTYRLTWEQGSGPCGSGCSFSDINKLGTITPRLSSLIWKCTVGCTGNTTMSDVNYHVTSVSNVSIGWEQGEFHFFHTFPGLGPYEITLDNVPWKSGLGRLITSINLERRNDSGLPNASPIAAVPPYIGIPFGCRHNISLPVEDPDADMVKCRLATSKECGGACTDLPNIAFLDEDTCSISVDATSANGYRVNTDYRVAVMLEDFPGENIELGNTTYLYNQALSKIPLQFIIRTVNSKHGCVPSYSSFALPTVNDGTRISFPGKSVVGIYKTGFYIQRPQNQTETFVASVPAGMNYSILPDDFNRTDITRLYSTWDPTKEQIGDAIYCAWGLDMTGITSEKRCVTSIINDTNECRSFPCKNSATCLNLFRRYKCICQHGFTGKTCAQRETCSDYPCKNNGTCVNTTTSYRCNCEKGYYGYNCQNDINECKSSPCSNGATCNNLVANFSCSCAPGFTGKTCNVSTDSSFLNSPLFWPVVGGGIGALVLAAATCCCLYWLLCGKKKKGKKDKQSIVPALENEVNPQHGKGAKIPHAWQ